MVWDSGSSGSSGDSGDGKKTLNIYNDIYENGKLKFSPKKMTALSHWVNFKGGMNPRERHVSPRGLQHRA